MPKDGNTNTTLSYSYQASKFSYVIYHRSFSSKLTAMRNSGFKGLALQYIIMDRFVGPTGLESIASQSTPCNSAQKSFQPWTNNINMDVVYFCVIHDSIVNGTPFDHDFKLSTPEIVVTE